jgi:hypothetical protein
MLGKDTISTRCYELLAREFNVKFKREKEFSKNFKKMKKNIFYGIAVAAIAAVAAWNVTLSNKVGENSLDLQLANVEAMAWEWNNPLDWLEYGARADEKIRETSCSSTTTTTTTSQVAITGSVSGYGVTFGASATTPGQTQTTETHIPAGKSISCEPGGNENCDACDCC